MNFAIKKRLDSLIGTPVLMGLSLAAKTLGAAMQRSHSAAPVHAVLVLKFQGMGSLAISKPAIADFRAQHPNAKIYFWGSKATCVLAREMPEFDGVFQLDDENLFSAATSLFKLLPELWALKLDWVFDLEVYSRLSSVLGTLTCARNRAGFAVKTVWYRKNVHTHLVMFNRYSYLGQAYSVLFGLASPELTPQYRWSPQKWKFQNTGLPDRTRPYIVINPHAGDLALERRWPIQNFQKLLGLLAEKYLDHDLVLIGFGREEVELSEYLAAGTRAINLSGKLKFSETIRLLSNAKLLITNDTGPLHLAVLGSAPVLALYGPTRPQSYLPVDRPALIGLSQNLYCAPCVHHWEPTPCGGNNQCMKQMTVEKVFECALGLIDGGEHFQNSANAVNSQADGYYAGLIYSK